MKRDEWYAARRQARKELRTFYSASSYLRWLRWRYGECFAASLVREPPMPAYWYAWQRYRLAHPETTLTWQTILRYRHKT